MFKTPSFRFAAGSRHLVHVFAIIGTACMISLPSWAQEQHPAQVASVVTRAEVIADLMRWQQAGMDRFQPLAISYGLETEAYQRASEEYARLRAVEQLQSETSKRKKLRSPHPIAMSTFALFGTSLDH